MLCWQGHAGWCSVKGLPAEFDFRHSTHKVDDTERFGMLIDQTAGIRVSYRRIKRA